MAQSNSYSWLLPDPYQNTIHSIGKARVTGEIQYFYKNDLRNIWVHPDALLSPYIISDPKGDSTVYFDLFTNNNVTPNSNGSHLHGAPASFINKYYASLSGTRNFIQSFYGQDWSWISAAADDELYNLLLEGDSISGGYKSPPHVNFVQYLREVPLNRQNFSASGTNFSSLNPIGTFNLPTIGEQVIQADGFFLTQPQTRPWLARESWGRGRWSLVAIGGSGIFTPSTLVISSNENNNGIGKIGIIKPPSTHFTTPSFNSHRTASINLKWQGQQYLPLFKLNPSPNSLPENHGLLLYKENTPGPGTGGLKRNGIILSPNIFIQFDIEMIKDMTLLPFTTEFGSSFNHKIWQIDMHITPSDTETIDTDFPIGGSTMYYRLAQGFGNGATFPASGDSIPSGKFTIGSHFVSTIKVYPVIDYPAKNGWILQAVKVTATDEAGHTESLGPPGACTVGPLFIGRCKISNLMIGID